MGRGQGEVGTAEGRRCRVHDNSVTLEGGDAVSRPKTRDRHPPSTGEVLGEKGIGFAEQGRKGEREKARRWRRAGPQCSEGSDRPRREVWGYKEEGSCT